MPAERLPAERPNVAVPAAVPAVVRSYFQINLDLSERSDLGTPFIRLKRLHRGTYPLTVSISNIQITMTRIMWGVRNPRLGTGMGVFYFSVRHHPNVPVTSVCVTNWFMTTFSGSLRAEQIRVAQYDPLDIREQDRVLYEFHPVLLVTPPPAQT